MFTHGSRQCVEAVGHPVDRMVEDRFRNGSCGQLLERFHSDDIEDARKFESIGTDVPIGEGRAGNLFGHERLQGVRAEGGLFSRGCAISPPPLSHARLNERLRDSITVGRAA